MPAIEEYISTTLEAAINAECALYDCSTHGDSVIPLPKRDPDLPLIGWCVFCGEHTGPNAR